MRITRIIKFSYAWIQEDLYVPMRMKEQIKVCAWMMCAWMMYIFTSPKSLMMSWKSAVTKLLPRSLRQHNTAISMIISGNRAGSCYNRKTTIRKGMWIVGLCLKSGCAGSCTLKRVTGALIISSHLVDINTLNHGELLQCFRQGGVAFSTSLKRCQVKKLQEIISETSYSCRIPLESSKRSFILFYLGSETNNAREGLCWAGGVINYRM